MGHLALWTIFYPCMWRHASVLSKRLFNWGMQISRWGHVSLSDDPQSHSSPSPPSCHEHLQVLGSYTVSKFWLFLESSNSVIGHTRRQVSSLQYLPCLFSRKYLPPPKKKVKKKISAKYPSPNVVNVWHRPSFPAPERYVQPGNEEWSTWLRAFLHPPPGCSTHASV